MALSPASPSLDFTLFLSVSPSQRRVKDSSSAPVVTRLHFILAHPIAAVTHATGSTARQYFLLVHVYRAQGQLHSQLCTRS